MAGRPGMPVAALHGVRPPVRQVIRKVAVVHCLLEHASDHRTWKGNTWRLVRARGCGSGLDESLTYGD